MSQQPGNTVLAEPDANGWIKHDGGPCPVEPDVFVDVLMRQAPHDAYGVLASKVRWTKLDRGGDITHYRLPKPEPDYKALLEKAVEALKMIDAYDKAGNDDDVQMMLDYGAAMEATRAALASYEKAVK